ncbi:MAG: DUF3147 family protein [Pseudomonadales bacterium]
MMYYAVKVATTVALIIAISELSKRSTFAGALLASIPLVSVIAMSWLYFETKDVQQVSQLAASVFWLVLPSLALFLTFPLLVNMNFSFPTALLTSIAITVASYFLMIWLLNYFGVRF